MDSEKSKCPACGSDSTKQLVNAPGFPAVIFAVGYENRHKMATRPIVAMGCDECNHLYLANINPEFNRRIYSDYYYLYPFGDLESMQAAYRKPFERVFEACASSHSSAPTLLEIGCSADKELEIFRAAGFICTGISPGAGAAHSEALIDGFYEKVLFEVPFDCIVTRFSLEHVIELQSFLEKIYSDLRPDGQLFVQVPNSECFLSNGVVSIFAHEHPQYFSCSSLSAALRRAKFRLEFVQARASDASIIAVARKARPGSNQGKRVLQNLETANAILELMDREKNARFVFYGAGLTLSGLLYLDRRVLNFTDRLSIVDDNPLLAGKCMPLTDIKIVALRDLQEMNSAVLFVFLNSVYHERVLPKVAACGFKKIYYLNGSGLREYK